MRGATVVSRWKGTAAMMSVSKLLMWGLFAFLLCLPLRAGAQTINAATCSSTDLQTALNKVAADGTTVSIPAGTCTWTAQVTYNQVYSTTIQGQTTCTGAGTQTPTCTDNTVISGPEYSFDRGV